MPRFEKCELQYFARSPNRRMLQDPYQRPDGSDGFRYAQVLFANKSCIACHTLPGQGDNSDGVPTTMPAAAQIRPLGIASIDMPSRINANQLLLNRVFILVAALLAATLAIIIFYLVTSRLILQPVRVLQETAEKVSEGDLNIRSDINTGDEFQVLSETFNTMLANLKNGADQLRSINKALDVKLGQL